MAKFTKDDDFTVIKNELKFIKNELKAFREDFFNLQIKIDQLTNLSKQNLTIEKDSLVETLNTVEKLYLQKLRPVQLIEISKFMNMSKDTIYSRVEKLIISEKLKKFYGREIHQKPSKSAFYAPNISLYDISIINRIENDKVRAFSSILINEFDEKELINGISIEKLISTMNMNKKDINIILKSLQKSGLITFKTEFSSDDDILEKIILI